MTTEGETVRPGMRLPVALVLAVILVALAVVVEPLRTVLVAPGPLVPGGLGKDDIVFAAITSIGDGPGLVALVGLIAIALVGARRVADAVFVVIAVAGATLITRIVKNLYLAPRPPTVDQASHIPTAIPGELVIAVVVVGVAIGLIRGGGMRALVGGGIVLVVLLLERTADRLVPVSPGFDSYPSGHAMSAAALATALILVTLRDDRWRLPVAIVATATAIAIGVSRVYLGVHYPIDVVGGWAIGVAWVTLWWLVWEAISRRWSAPQRIRLEAVD